MSGRHASEEPKPEVDAETAAARRLSLAKSLADPAKRKAWLEEIVRDYPETDAATPGRGAGRRHQVTRAEIRERWSGGSVPPVRVHRQD